MARPDGEALRFGVATAGFQTEGGFNGPSEPQNNWYEWEAAGRIEPSGIAVDFWNRPAEHFERAQEIGVDSFRLSLEWARIEPAEGRIDEGAFEGYVEILDACRRHGMEPLVTLCHFTHPAWLGTDFWTRSDSPQRFADFAALAAERLKGRCALFVTLNEINILALMSFFLGTFPPGRRLDGASALRAADHLLTAHVLAYAALKAQMPSSTVGTNNCALSIYELDRLGIDLLCARSRGVKRADLGAHLSKCRADWYAGPSAAGAVIPGGDRGLRGPGLLGGGRGFRGPVLTGGGRGLWGPVLEEGLRRLAGRLVDPERSLPRAVDAVYASPHERTLDVIQLDYYDPATADHLQLPGRRTAGGRALSPSRPLWDDQPSPEGLRAYLAAEAEPGLDVWIVENGLCNRVRRGRSYPRLDGWTRPRYLEANLAAIAQARREGIPISGYWHWCLVDNYEWGTYEPRFGLYGLDRERGLSWSGRDSMGADAAGTFGRLIEAIRRGDAVGPR